MLVILDRHHGWKGDRFDPGAQHGGLREVDLSAAYLGPCGAHLESAGVEVLHLGSGPYSTRQAGAIAAATARGIPCVYIAAHVNAGQGRYAAVFHDARSTRGALIALCIEDALERALPEVSHVKVIGASPKGWTSGAWHTIQRIYDGPSNISGICFEPGFIDQPEHAALWTPEGLERIGIALAEGILGYRAELDSR